MRVLVLCAMVQVWPGGRLSLESRVRMLLAAADPNSRSRHTVSLDASAPRREYAERT